MCEELGLIVLQNGVVLVQYHILVSLILPPAVDCCSRSEVGRHGKGVCAERVVVFAMTTKQDVSGDSFLP
jgi:hypothetical protein